MWVQMFWRMEPASIPTETEVWIGAVSNLAGSCPEPQNMEGEPCRPTSTKCMQVILNLDIWQYFQVSVSRGKVVAGLYSHRVPKLRRW